MNREAQEIKYTEYTPNVWVNLLNTLTNWNTNEEIEAK